jgi:nitrogen fixation/metabolism regulation signal transduction histidine kinase
MENTDSQAGQNRRRHYWVEKGFQRRVIINLALLVVGTIVVAHIVAVGYMKLAQTTAAAGTNWNALKSGMNINFSGFLNSLWLPMLITILLGIIFVLGFGLLYSHRIAGPLFNLKRVMSKIGHGELNSFMHIRATDEFHDVENVFNQMVVSLKARHETLRQAIANLPEPGRKKLEKLYQELFKTGEFEKESELV